MPPLSEIAPFAGTVGVIVAAWFGWRQAKEGQRRSWEQQRLEAAAAESDKNFDRVEAERDKAVAERDKAVTELHRRDALLWPHRQFDFDMVSRARAHGCDDVSIDDFPPLV